MPAHEVERVEAERLLQPAHRQRPLERRAEHPARGRVRDHLVGAGRREQEPVGHALDHPLEPLALPRVLRAERPQRGAELVHEHVEHARVARTERAGRCALEEDDARDGAVDLERHDEPRPERARAARGAQHADLQRGLGEPGPGVLRVRRQGVLLHLQERRVGEPRHGAEEEDRRGARGREQRRRDVARDHSREPLDHLLEEPRVALGDARLARDLRRDLERLEPPLGLREETRVVPLSWTCSRARTTVWRRSALSHGFTR